MMGKPSIHDASTVAGLARLLTARERDTRDAPTASQGGVAERTWLHRRARMLRG